MEKAIGIPVVKCLSHWQGVQPRYL